MGVNVPKAVTLVTFKFKGKAFTDFRIIIGCVDYHPLKFIVYFLLTSMILPLFNITSYKWLSVPFS